MESIKKRGVRNHNPDFLKILNNTHIVSNMKAYQNEDLLTKDSSSRTRPMIWRRIRVDGITSLANLHDIIQVTYGWDDNHLHQFHIYGKDYGISYDGGLSFSDNAHKVHLDDFSFEIGDKFSYEYNFFEHWVHDIRIENMDESPLQQRCHAFCVKGSGMPRYTKHDEIDATMKLLKAIVKYKKLRKIDFRHLIEKLDVGL